jgi:NADH-quinone oxidoreductase subunit L
VLPASTAVHDLTTEALLQVLAVLAFAIGLAGAYLLFLRRRAEQVASQRLPGVPERLEAFLLGGCGFDALYEAVFVRPVRWFAEANKADAVDRIFTGIATGLRLGYAALSPSQNGQLRRYAAVVVLGTAALVALVVFG